MKEGQRIEIGVEFLEQVVGGVPVNREVFETYIVGRIIKDKTRTEEQKQELRDEEILAAQKDIPAIEQKGHTTFMMEDGKPYVWAYWIRGFIKNAMSALMESKDIHRVPMYKHRVMKFVHVKPMDYSLRGNRRKLFFTPENGSFPDPLPVLERPLIGMTPRGPTTALAKSDCLPAGTKLEFWIELLKNDHITEDMLREVFGYGVYMGMGQWPSGGNGLFELMKFVGKKGGEAKGKRSERT